MTPEWIAVQCADIPEYVSVVRHAESLSAERGGRLVPFLDTDTILRSIDAAPVIVPYASLGLEHRHSLDVADAIEDWPGRGDATCIVWAGDELASAGFVHARIHDKTLRIVHNDRDLERAVDGSGSIVLVMSPGRVERIGCDRLCGVIHETARPWGLITATTLASASQLVARTRLRRAREKPAGVICGTDFDTAIELSGLQTVTLPPYPAPDLLAAALQDRAFAVFMGHGRSYCAVEGSLCSLDDPASAGDARCIPGFECVYASSPRVPATSVRVDVAVLELCATAAFKSNAVEPTFGRNLAVQLVDGWASAIVSPYRNHRPVPFARYLAWMSAVRGDMIGETCRLLNRLAEQRTGAPAPYLLIGDPELRVFSGRGRPEAPPPVVRSGSRASIAVVPGAVVHCVLDTPPAPGQIVHPLVADDVADRIAIEVLSGEGPQPRTELFVAAGEGFDRREVDVVLAGRDAFRQETIDIAEEIAGRLAAPRDGSGAEGVAGSPEVAYLIALLEAARTLPGVADADVRSAPAYLHAMETEKEILAACERAQAASLDRMLAQAARDVQWLHEHFRREAGFKWLDAERSDAPCPYCSGRLLCRRYRVGLWPAGYREVVECERCLVIADRPRGEASVEMLVTERIAVGRTTALRLSGRNVGRVHALVHAAVYFHERGERKGRITVAPSARVAGIAPGDRYDLTFAVDALPDVCSHAVYAQAIVVANGLVNCALRRLNVVRDPPALEVSYSSGRSKLARELDGGM